MPQKDTSHDSIKQALINDGWEITDDPYVISYDEYSLFVDIGAVDSHPVRQAEGKVIGLQRGEQQIAVEIKEFRGKSFITDLERAIGQYVLYRLLLKRTNSSRTLYLAVTDSVYADLFETDMGRAVITDVPLQLIVVSVEKMEVLQWITPESIARS